MSRRLSKIEAENQKIKSELKKLKSDVERLKKISNQIKIPTSKQTLIFKLQENFDPGISPLKPPSRSRSPISSYRQKSSCSPSCKQSSAFALNKENFKTFEFKSKSPEFLNISIPATGVLAEHKNSLNDTSRQNIDELQTLERENKMLKELNQLRKENKLLRSQIKLKNSKRPSKAKKKSEDIFEAAISPNRIFHKRSLSVVSPSPRVKKIERSPSLCPVSPTSFYDNISFTGSSEKNNEKSRDYLDMPRKVEKYVGSCRRLSPGVTPRIKDCLNRDEFLCKGFSTSIWSQRYNE